MLIVVVTYVVLNLGTDGKQYAAHLLDIAHTLKKSERAWSPINGAPVEVLTTISVDFKLTQ